MEHTANDSPARGHSSFQMVVLARDPEHETTQHGQSGSAAFCSQAGSLVETIALPTATLIEPGANQTFGPMALTGSGPYAGMLPRRENRSRPARSAWCSPPRAGIPLERLS